MECLRHVDSDTFIGVFLEINKDETSFSFEFWLRHHEMVCNDHYEDENPQKIGKEAEVLVVKHL